MLRLVMAWLFAACWALDASAQTSPPRGQAAAKRLASVKSWGYQLQGVNPAEIAASPFDLVVVDYSRNGIDAGRFSSDDVRTMQTKPDGTRRIVLAYLSIGEAEDYRFYWQKNWVEPAPMKRSADGMQTSANIATVRIPKLIAPGWLGRENETWTGNFHVRFWYDSWQEILMHNTDSYLARIQAAGFDGVYLDRVDVYYALEADSPGAGEWMVNLVVELADIARRTRPNFIIVPQNAEELLQSPRYLAAIDGIAKEDVLFGNAGDGIANPPPTLAATEARLRLAIANGLTVLAVEYLSEPVQAMAAAAALSARRYLPYIATRKLDRLVAQPVTPRPTAP